MTEHLVMLTGAGAGGEGGREVRSLEIHVLRSQTQVNNIETEQDLVELEFA